MDGTRCVVTGGAGFVGSHLVDALLEQGCYVTAVDNLSTGRVENLDSAMNHPHFRFMQLDAGDAALMAPLVAHCDELYHLASYVGVKLASQTSSQTILNNLRSIDTILGLVTHYRPKLLLTSTSEVYGKALDFAADDSLTLAEHGDRVYGSTEVHRWSYAGTKAVEEFLTLAKHHEEGLHNVIVRLFNVIGPRQIGLHGPVVPRFMTQALTGEPVTIYGDGRQTRCFTDVSDAIDAITILMRHPGAAGEVFNVGSDTPISIGQLAQEIVRLSGSTSPIEYVPHESVFGTHFEDVQRRIPNVSKAREWTGLAFNRPLEETLQRIISHHSETISSSR